MRQIPPELEAALVEAYRTTDEGGKPLARRFGVGATTLYRVLRRNGLLPDGSKLRPPPRTVRLKYDEATRQDISQRYAAGERPKAIAAAYGCSVWTVREIVRKQGLSPLPHGGQRRAITDEEKAEMIRLYGAGESQERIAAYFGVHQTTVSDVLRAAGIVHPERSGERHGSWKGGRFATPEGYILVRPPIDSPFNAMRSSNGYIPEHRLVMAQHLGRPLARHETVHHVNGDKQDNRIENLQLRIGRHGRGVAYCCGDCGSRNLVPVPLD